MITPTLLDSWVNRNIRHFCLEGLRGSNLALARRNASMEACPPELPSGEWLYRRDSEYQCAHFVAHVLRLNEDIYSEPSRRRPDHRRFRGVSHVNVARIAQRCRNFRPLEITFKNGEVHYPESETSPALIYVCVENEIRVGRRNSPDELRRFGRDRHIGFYIRGQVWHYDNRIHCGRVVSVQLGRGVGDERFYNRYSGSNGIPRCEMWLSDIPQHGQPRRFTFYEHR
jgi:hypothetical protein